MRHNSNIGSILLGCVNLYESQFFHLQYVVYDNTYVVGMF